MHPRASTREVNLNSMISRIPVAITLASTLWVQGCGSPCPPSELYFDKGTLHRAGGTLLWESSPAAGPLVPFTGATTLHLRHRLGVRPLKTDIELSFSEFPERPGGGGLTDAAGNQALKLLQNEDEVVLKNDSCANYYIRVTIRAVAPAPP